MLLIPLPLQRNETGVVAIRILQSWTGNTGKRRWLIEVAIKPAEDPLELGDKNCGAHSRIGSALRESTLKVRLPKAGDQRKPRRRFVAVLGKEFLHSASDLFRLVKVLVAPVVEDHAESVMFMLAIGIKPRAQRVLRDES